MAHTSASGTILPTVNYNSVGGILRLVVMVNKLLKLVHYIKKQGFILVLQPLLKQRVPSKTRQMSRVLWQ